MESASHVIEGWLPLILLVLMLGLGLGLTVDDFRRAVVAPRAVMVGLGCQIVVLPLVCLALVHGFGLEAELAVGMMLLAASPGGIVANLFSHLARGDVALNITLTAVNGLSSLVTLPLVVGWSIAHFFHDTASVPVQTDKLVQILLIVIVPVAVGMGLRARWPRLAGALDKPVRVIGAFFLLLLIASTLYQTRDAFEPALVRRVGGAALAFNLASLVVGVVVPRLARLDRRQAIAIGMEVSVHNAGLAIVLARIVLERPLMAAPPAIYAAIMTLTATLFVVVVSRARRIEGVPAQT